MHISRCCPVVASVALLWSAGAISQTHFSGTQHCTRTEPAHVLNVGDQPDHTMGVEQFKCDWTKPFKIGMDESKTGVATDTNEAWGPKGRFNGREVMTLASGDQVLFAYHGATTTKDGKPSGSQGTFEITDGTGKHKGVKGNGKFTCGGGDGFDCELTGRYHK